MADTDFWLKYLFSHERWVKRLKGLHDGRRKQNLKVGRDINVSKSSPS